MYIIWVGAGFRKSLAVKVDVSLQRSCNPKTTHKGVAMPTLYVQSRQL